MIRFLKLWSFTIAEIIMVSFALMFIAFFCLGDINYAVIWMLTLPLYSFLGIGLRIFCAIALFVIAVGKLYFFHFSISS